MGFKERLGKGKVWHEKKKKDRERDWERAWVPGKIATKKLSVCRVQPSLDRVRLPCETCQVTPWTPLL